MIAGLVTRASKGDRSAWEHLVDRYSRLIWTTCQDYRLNEVSSADVAQVVWLRLLRQLEHIDNPGDPAHLGIWIADTTRNECLRALAAESVRRRADQVASNLRARKRVSVTRFSVRGLTGLAALLAGREGPSLLEEWKAHLAGESGHDPVTWRKVQSAIGFVIAAIHYRLQDAADIAWIVPDAILKSRALSNLFALAPTGVAAYIVLHQEGTLGAVKAAEGITAIGAALYGLIRLGRWWRDVKPPEPKARRAKE
jgi:DNA-directed RNA polymerase specialized sigma24 family protein